VTDTDDRTTTDTVPMLDLAWQHRAVESEVAQGFERVMAQSSYILGPEVTAFEEQFAAFSGVKHVIGVGNGTDAVELALRAAGVGRDDDAVTPAHASAAARAP
jgi:dTDP-4-amino-4,6-dideoxygalactose transaminase